MNQIVVAAALVRNDGHVLVQRRRAGTQHGGLWEFPGGKQEPGEAPDAALARELLEELGITVALADLVPAGFAAVPLPGREEGAQLLLLLYRCDHWVGQPLCLDADALAWVDADGLCSLPMPPADIPLARALAASLRR